MWEQSKTVFVTFNIPGGSNNDFDAWNDLPHAEPAAEQRMSSPSAGPHGGRRPLAEPGVREAEADNAHSVVIIGQADMWDTADAPAHQTLYEPIVEAMADNTTTFGKPVLYLNGDSHVYRSDNPLQQGSTCYTESGACPAQAGPCSATTATNTDAWCQHPYYDVPNFHRIVVHGSTFPMEWLKLSIDPRAAWENARRRPRGARSAGSARSSGSSRRPRNTSGQPGPSHLARPGWPPAFEWQLRRESNRRRRGTGCREDDLVAPPQGAEPR